MTNEPALPPDDVPEPVRRDFLSLVTVATAGLGACAFAWPFLDSLGRRTAPEAADTAVDVDLASLAPGQQVVAEWRGMRVCGAPPPADPRRRPQGEATRRLLRDPDSAERQQPAYAANWHRSIVPEFGVMVGICTHLGCVPKFRPRSGPGSGSGPGPEPEPVDGDGAVGYACPCHGSRFDLAGRVFHGAPAQYNLPVPPYRLVEPSRLRIGVDPDGPAFDFDSIAKI